MNNSTKYLSLSHITKYPIEDTLKLYREGYILGPEHIYPIQTFPIELSCTNRQISIGGTLAGLWGYIWKASDIDITARTALVYLYDANGNVVDTKTMTIGDSSLVTNPSDSTQNSGIFVTNIYIGVETKVLVVDFCEWTQQTSSITYISVPSTFEDGTSYTITGRVTKSISGPIVGEKVYLRENDISIENTTTGSDGLFNFTFTFHAGFNYSTYYPGTNYYGITIIPSIEETVTIYQVPNATHLVTCQYPVQIPDYVVTAFKAITNPVSVILEAISSAGTDITGWTLLDIKMSSDQLSLYYQETSSVAIDLVVYATVFAAAGAVIGFFAEEFGGSLWGAAIGAAFGTVLAVLTNYQAVVKCLQAVFSCIGTVIGDILSTFSNKSTNGDVNNNIDGSSGLGKFLDQCKKDYDGADKSTPDKAKSACLDYIQCMTNAYSGVIQFTKGYLFPNALNDLTKLANQLRTDANNQCISQLQQDKIACDQAIACVQGLGQTALTNSDSSVSRYYSSSDTYTAPWEKPGGTEGSPWGTIMIAGLVLIGGFAAYKIYSSRKQKATIEIKGPNK